VARQGTPDQPLGLHRGASSRPTDFEQILIGLIVLQPRSGYDLKRHFASTPSSVYQPSSGALYPALRRLQGQGLLQQVPPTADQHGGLTRRRRHVYQVTSRGREVHGAWIREPVDPATVAQDLGMHLMRFVMMESQLPRAEVLAFLSSLQEALAHFLEGIERYTATLHGSAQHDHVRLALEHGIAVHRASLDWTAEAITALSAPDGSLRRRHPA
jgi:PadR family transcriptional regulator, regulatory protein AphA